MKIEIDVPAEIVSFLKNMAVFVQQDPDQYLKTYLEYQVKWAVKADLDNLSDDSFFNRQELIERYDLAEIFATVT